MARPLSLAAGLLTAGMAFETAAQPRQPEVVCDFGRVLVGTVESGTLRLREAADPLRITFRDIDPKAGTARVTFGEGASGEEFASVTVEASAITYLVERSGVFKMLVTTGNKPTAEGWPAMMSHHGLSSGELTLRTAAGSCRMRAR